MRGPVVVGVDGAPSARGVVEAAAREAERRGTALRLVHAIGWSSGVVRWDPAGGGVRDRVGRMLTEAERVARRAAPLLDVTQEVLMGEPESVLETESRDASLTVVGGHFPVARPRKGSVAPYLTAHARCPVLVVRGRPEPAGAVVLAADGSWAMREAAEFAFAEAAARGAELMALRRGQRSRGAPDGLAGILRDRRKSHPEVTVHDRPVPGRLGRTLTDVSAHAQLVVVAARGRRGLPRLPWDGTSRFLLRDAGCPVAVVPSNGHGG
ncbi:universal stress protein [Streptomyces sp. NPDC001978]|uniref:universal stress protein n=1 Tax=Streptomyces sp. NPDC001978 TaxID=3364627 RepID=UPI0036AA2632